MSKKSIIGVVGAAILVFAALSGGGNSNNTTQTSSTAANSPAETVVEHSAPICDGKAITSNCELEGVSYKTYTYHPAVPEKTHTETITSYREEITGYCTLCNDGTYSPSCATGRGACSHHGGVAQWNAPRSSRTPVYDTKVVVDAPAQEAYYEKIAE